MKTTPLLLTMTGLMGFVSIALAQQGQPVAGYKQLDIVTLPGGLAGNDISWVDSVNGRYYLADRGNANSSPVIPPRVDVIDTVNDQFITSVTLPAGANGIVAVPKQHQIWVGLNDSTVQVISTDTLNIVHSVSTGGTARADETAYDPADHMLLIANDRDAPPFVSFISTDNYTVVKRLTYDGTAAPQSTGGIEQPVWDGAIGKFYIAIPATAANANGEIDEIDPASMSVTRAFPTACKGPSGLVLIPGQRLAAACGDVVDILTGKVVTTVQGVSGDEIWYNSGDNRIYFTGGVNLYVVDGSSYTIVATLVVGQTVPSPGVNQTTHSVSADSENNKIFVPVTAVGVEVWRNGASINVYPNPIQTSASAVAAFVSWNAPNASIVEVHVGSPSGPLLTHYNNHGTVTTGPWLSDGMTLYLQDVSSGQALTAANTLATTVVHLQH